MNIRRFDSDRDLTETYVLWQRAVGHQWPIDLAVFEDHMARQDAVFVALDGDSLTGFVAVGRDGHVGGVSAVAVDPRRTREGIGRGLVEEAVAHLRERGATEVRAGGVGAYFWPGVPDNLPEAKPFFRACGWRMQGAAYDLCRDLRDYATPEWVNERAAAADIGIVNAGKGDTRDLLDFADAHFPDWRGHYLEAVEQGRWDDILLAKDAGGTIAGAVLLFGPGEDFLWSALLGRHTGGFGDLGVAESERSQGTGLALAARATELVRDRGARKGYVGWTWLVDWYGKLGYELWRSYRTGLRKS